MAWTPKPIHSSSEQDVAYVFIEAQLSADKKMSLQTHKNASNYITFLFVTAYKVAILIVNK